MLERQRVDDAAVRILRVDPVAEIDNSIADIAGHQVAGGEQHRLLQRVEIGIVAPVVIDQLVDAVAKVQEYRAMESLRASGGSADRLSAAEANFFSQRFFTHIIASHLNLCLF